MTCHQKISSCMEKYLSPVTCGGVFSFRMNGLTLISMHFVSLNLCPVCWGLCTRANRNTSQVVGFLKQFFLCSGSLPPARYELWTGTNGHAVHEHWLLERPNGPVCQAVGGNVTRQIVCVLFCKLRVSTSCTLLPTFTGVLFFTTEKDASLFLVSVLFAHQTLFNSAD